MEEVKDVVKFEDIVKGNVFWEVNVELHHDGRIRTYGVKKIVPLSNPYYVTKHNNKNPNLDFWGFNLRTSFGNIVPKIINEYAILTPDGRILYNAYDDRCRLFKTRKAGIRYAIEVLEYKQSEEEKSYRLEMAEFFGEDAFGMDLPDESKNIGDDHVA